MVWLPALIQHNHDVQNPISRAKLRTVFARLRLGPDDHVLDIGAGRCVPAVLLAVEHGCRVTAVERYAGFAAAGRAGAVAAGVADRVEVVESDGAGYPRAGETYAAALCLGASAVYGGFGPALDRLRAGVRPGGHVVVGEPYARVPGQAREGAPLPGLDGLLAAVTERGLRPVGVVTAAEDDWDTYHSMHLLALEDWLDRNPDDPDTADVAAAREECVAQFLAERDLGWAVVGARVP